MPTGLLRYAFVDVLRNRRRTFSAILGVLLAITFIAGTFIAIDSSARATLDGLLGTLSADMAFLAPPSNGTLVRQAVEAVPGVIGVRVSRFAQFGEVGSDAVGRADPASVQGIDPGRIPYSLEPVTVIAGSLDLPRGTIALTDDLLGVQVGDPAYFQFTQYDDSGNETRSRINVTVGALVRASQREFGPVYRFGTAFVHIQDVDWYEGQLGVPYGGNQIAGEIRVDRDRLLDPYDLEGSRRNVARLERQIAQALLPFGGQVFNSLDGTLQNFSGAIAAQRLIYLALSAPVLFLGLYLGAIGVDLGHAERRRELAVLKTRGAGRRQLVGLLLLEAVLGGLIAAFAGLLAGVGLSRLLLGVVNPFTTGSSPKYELLVLAPSTIAIVAILSMIFMALVSFRSARRTALLPIVETLRYHAPGETKIQYKPTIDIIFVALAALTYGMVLYTLSSRGDFLVFLVGTLFFVLLPFAPIFLIIGTTRLLTRSTARIYEWTSRACKPFAKNLYYVITRNLTRNPRRSANVALIIALGLAFGMFVYVTFASQLTTQEWQVRASIGADLAASPPTFDEGFGANVSALPEVAGVTRFRTVPVPVPYGYAAVHALDPSTYFSVTQPEPWYFRGIDSAGAKEILETPGNVLATEAYLREAFLAVGDRLTFRVDEYNDTGFQGTLFVNVTIGGTVRGLPGTGFFGFGLPTAIYGSLETMRPILEFQSQPYYGSDRYLVDLKAGADWRSAKEGILALGAFDIQVAAEQLEALRSNPVFRALFGFIEMEIAFMVVILTAGLGLILFAATLERDVELAAVRARGASGWQTAGLLVGEAFSIMLIGMAVGVGLGVLTAFLSTQIVASGPGVGESLVPVAFTVPWEAILLVVLAPTAMLLTALAVALRVARMDVARVLKLRGG